MKHRLAALLNRNVAADHTVFRIAQIACFLAGVLVLALSLWKLPRLDLTEAQLFCGVLLSATVPLLFIVIGLLLPSAMPAKGA